MAELNKVKNLIINTAILGIGNLATKVMSFAIVPLFSRKLPLADYGEFDVLYTYISLLVPIISLSIGEGAFRFLIDAEDDESKKKTIITTSFLTEAISIAVGVLLMFLMVPQSKYKSLFVLLVVSNASFEYLMYLLRGLKQLKLYTVASIIYMVMMCSICLSLLYGMGMNAKGLFIGYSAGYICAIVFILIRMRFLKYIKINAFSRITNKELIKYSLPMIPNGVSWWIANASDRTIIRVIIGSEGNAIYAIANKIPAICTSLYSVFHLSWQQSASEEIGTKGFELFVNKVLNRIIILLITIGCGILSLNFLMFKYIFDARYLNSYYHVAILLSAVLFLTLSTYFGGLFISMKKTTLNGATTVLAAFVNVIVHISLIRFAGLYAASISTLVSYFVIFIVRYWVINKTIHIRLEKRVWSFTFIYLYFVLLQYLRVDFLEYVNIVIAVLVFIIGNKDVMAKIINRVKR